MQPRELVLEGFTAYPRRTVIDFTEATLFAIVGATGAGKSSLVDAIVFSLYGRVPRLGLREIGPILSSGSTECTVGFTFAVRGDGYRVVRQAKKTRAGATTAEAVLDRLDADGEVAETIAGTADDVTVAVQRLLGLGFEEFTRTVVLPQGEFAAFLKAAPNKRRDLLARLLGTAVYDRVMQLANLHAKLAAGRLEMVEAQLADLGDTSDAVLAAARERVERLDRLTVALEQLQAERDELKGAYEERRRVTDVAADAVRRLATVGPPPASVCGLAEHIALADRAVADTAKAHDEAERLLGAAQEDAAALGDADALQAARRAHQIVAELAARETAETTAVAERAARVEQLVVERDAAVALAASTADELTALQRADAAAAAAHGLHAGDPCPVCERPLKTAPSLPAVADLVTVERAAASAATRAGRLAGVLESAEAELASARKRAADAAAQLEDARTVAADLEPLDVVEQRLASLRDAAADVQRLTAAATAARTAARTAAAARAALTAEETGARAQLDAVRLTVADLALPTKGPVPGVDGTLVEAWLALAAWARALEPAALAAQADADAAVAAALEEGVALRAAMVAACTAERLDVGTEQPVAVAARARGVADSALTQLEAAADKARALAGEVDDARAQRQVGQTVGQLLRSDAFQDWLLEEATRRLVRTATTHLLTLSANRYELDVVRNDFWVVDLANAGARRTAKTLSGGETFLASLALALALAGEIAASASGPVAMESLFLDEGFGSLDPEALDIAAAAIELLGTADRTVGVITHVRDLADRLPTRFEVRAGPGGSTVERVDA